MKTFSTSLLLSLLLAVDQQPANAFLGVGRPMGIPSSPLTTATTTSKNTLLEFRPTASMAPTQRPFIGTKSTKTTTALNAMGLPSMTASAAAAIVTIAQCLHLFDEGMFENNYFLASLGCKPRSFLMNFVDTFSQIGVLTFIWFLSTKFSLLQMTILGLGILHPILDHNLLTRKYQQTRPATKTAYYFLLPVSLYCLFAVPWATYFTTKQLILGALSGIAQPVFLGYLGMKRVEDSLKATKKMKEEAA